MFYQVFFNLSNFFNKSPPLFQLWKLGSMNSLKFKQRIATFDTEPKATSSKNGDTPSAND